MHKRTQEKEAVTLQETDLDFPVSVQESSAETWVRVDCCRFGGIECSSAYIRPFEEGHKYLPYLHHCLATGKKTGREPDPTHQQKIELKIY